MAEILKIVQSNRYIFALAIFVGSIIAAFIVKVIVTRVLLRLARKTTTTLDEDIVLVIKRPLFLSVVLVGVGQALAQLVIDEQVRSIITKVLVSLGVLLWTGAGMRTAESLLAALARRADSSKFVQQRTLPLFEITLKTVIVGGAAYGILLAWHVDVTAWLASAGIVGIAIGFAAKDTLANLFSGIFILADAPYKIGDFIVLDSGERGEVTEIGIRSTRILTRDDLQIIIRNGLEKQRLMKDLETKIKEINKAYTDLQDIQQEILKTFA